MLCLCSQLEVCAKRDGNSLAILNLTKKASVFGVIIFVILFLQICNLGFFFFYLLQCVLRLLNMKMPNAKKKTINKQ